MSDSESSENYDNMDTESYDLAHGICTKWQGSSKKTTKNR